MATTRLMPLHTGKGRTVGQAISAIIDYTENPQKTDGGRLITSWQCDSRIADAEFLFTKNQYIQKTGRVRGEDDVIAYRPIAAPELHHVASQAIDRGERASKYPYQHNRL